MIKQTTYALIRSLLAEQVLVQEQQLKCYTACAQYYFKMADKNDTSLLSVTSFEQLNKYRNLERSAKKALKALRTAIVDIKSEGYDQKVM